MQIDYVDLEQSGAYVLGPWNTTLSLSHEYFQAAFSNTSEGTWRVPLDLI
ncbi:hypothetical protein [Methylocaldum szegediense]|nr:hypothetical protein [Methylocaldum szegediense]